MTTDPIICRHIGRSTWQGPASAAPRLEDRMTHDPEAAERLAERLDRTPLRDMSDLPEEAAALIRAQAAEIDELRLLSDEADFIRHEGGSESVAAMEEAMRDTVLPLLRRNAEDLLRCVAVGADPATISGSDWRDIADDLEAVLTVERFLGRPDDEYGRVLDPVLDAASWREHT